LEKEVVKMKNIKSFDVISDVHLEDYLNEKTMFEFVQEILPEKPNKLLVFAGDFGYENRQTIAFIKELRKTYETILFVYGNNDLKLPRSNPENFKNVPERIESLNKQIENINGVHYLNGKTFNWGGLVFGGSDIFYDFDEIKQNLGLTYDEIYAFWKEKNLDDKHREWIIDPKSYAEEDKNKLRNIIEKTDIIITHGPPNYFVDEEDKKLGFFRFDGEEFKEKIKDKIWIYGHRHKRHDEIKYGCRFINAAYAECKSPRIIQIKKALN
jgi:predicted phosphodiesterase